MDDREFLGGLYAAGAAGCFDVLSVHDYGYGLSPEDGRGAHGGLNLARILDLRDIVEPDLMPRLAYWALREIGK